ncbi:hypothetical protein C8K18_11829 [Paraburkholderia sp. GV068]|nr:hypothetical protein C8K19_11829 [Paraburkholderia sp. GV072]PUA99736.1 hypothetical protein C8K18_11829 [Paraburkholderia sp. GV068]
MREKWAMSCDICFRLNLMPHNKGGLSGASCPERPTIERLYFASTPASTPETRWSTPDTMSWGQILLFLPAVNQPVDCSSPQLRAHRAKDINPQMIWAAASGLATSRYRVRQRRVRRTQCRTRREGANQWPARPRLRGKHRLRLPRVPSSLPLRPGLGRCGAHIDGRIDAIMSRWTHCLSRLARSSADSDARPRHSS